jgi:rubrerythrin
MELKGSQTEINLRNAFAGESQAHAKYSYYASKAKKEGYEQIAAIFEETAENEKEHAKLWFKALHGNDIPTTTINLQDAADGEHYEWTSMYKDMAATARKEGFLLIAAQMEGVAKIEAEHEARYLKLLENVKEGKVFIAPDVVIWKCRNCGHIHVGKEAPKVCPVCQHPQSFFELRVKNY